MNDWNWITNFIFYRCEFDGGTPGLKIDVCIYPAQALIVLSVLLVFFLVVCFFIGKFLLSRRKKKL